MRIVFTTYRWLYGNLKWVSVFALVLLAMFRVLVKATPSLNFHLDIPSPIPTYNYLEAEALSTVAVGILFIFERGYTSLVSSYLVKRQIHSFEQLLWRNMKSWTFVAAVFSVIASLPMTYVSWKLWTAHLSIVFQLLHSLPFCAGNIDNLSSGTFTFFCLVIVYTLRSV